MLPPCASSLDIDRLYRLLPATARQQDIAQGEPLRALLQLIADEVDLLEESSWARGAAPATRSVGRSAVQPVAPWRARWAPATVKVDWRC